MIDPHYSRTICRYVDELVRKNDLMLCTRATPALMREVSVLSLTIKNLADAALADAPAAPDRKTPWTPRIETASDSVWSPSNLAGIGVELNAKYSKLGRGAA